MRKVDTKDILDRLIIRHNYNMLRLKHRLAIAYPLLKKEDWLIDYDGRAVQIIEALRDYNRRQLKRWMDRNKA